MGHHVITLKTKLIPPRLNDVVRRPRLDTCFEKLKEIKLMTVIAGAGFGKSTAVAQGCARQGFTTIWYRLDAFDRDVLVLVHHLVAGIRHHFASFGELILEHIRSNHQLKIEWQSIIRVLLHEMEQVMTQTSNLQLTIVLDDFHLIQDNEEICAAMHFLIKNLPHGVHLVLISRTSLNLDVAGLIAVRSALTITERELCFTREEIAVLYRQVFNLVLPNKELNVLERRTKGWAAGLVLFHYTLHENTPAPLERQLDLFSSNNRLFADYLQENIFKALPDDIRRFLLKSSILDDLEVKFCNQLLAIDNAGEILDFLERRHLFTFALDDQGDIYHYHHLFRDFLKSRLKAGLNADELRQLYIRAARLCEERDAFYEAIPFYLMAEEYETVCRMMAKEGYTIIQRKGYTQCLAYCEQIPNALSEKEPHLKLLQGTLLYLKSRIPEAIDAFEHARCLFESLGDRENAGLCLSRMITIYCIRNDYIKSANLARQVIAWAPQSSETYLDTLSNLIYIESRMGNFKAADKYFKMAQVAMEDMGETFWPSKIFGFYCYRFLLSGDYFKAIHYAEKAVRIAIRFKVFSWVVGCYHVISFAMVQLGGYTESFETALKGIRLSEQYGLVEAGYIWCLLNAGQAKAGMGDLAEALAYCRKSLKLSCAVESDWSEAWCRIAICRILCKSGDFIEAEVEGRRALDAIERTPLELDKKFIKTALAYVLLKRGRTDEARSMIPPVETLSRSNKNLFHWVELFNVYLHWVEGRIEAATTGLCNVLTEFRIIKPMLEDQKDWILPLLAKLYAEGNRQTEIVQLSSLFQKEPTKNLEYFTRSKEARNRKAANFLLNLIRKRKVEDLHIRCFGPFALSKGGTEIPAKAWSSAKAKMLLKYLAFHSRHGYIPKDQLLELLWPEQDPYVTNKRLHVALSAIRKILEPELARGESSAYLLRQDDTYKLSLGPGGVMDVSLFDHKLTAAREAENPQEALAMYLAAESIYNGPLFEEDLYSQWCLDAREAYQEKYVGVMKAVAVYYRRQKNYSRCIDYLIKILQIDPYAEDVYCLLMEAYHLTGNRFMAVRTFEKCRDKLEKELQCPLSDDTTGLYHRIVSV